MRRGFLPGLFVLLLTGCTTSVPAPKGPETPVLVEDDQRLVEKEHFLTDYPDWKSPGALVSWKQTGNQVEFRLEKSPPVLIQFLGPQVFRFFFHPLGQGADEPSYAVVQRDFGPVSLQVRETSGAVILDSGQLEISCARNPFQLTVRRNGQVLCRETRPLAWAKTRVADFMETVEGDRFYGLGEKTGPLLKNGQSIKNWNTDSYRYKKDTDPLYSTIPFFVNAGKTRSYGLFFDNTYQSFFNMDAEKKGEYYFGATNGALDYTFLGQPSLPEVVRAYAALTGRMEMPPLWSLGYQQSRYSYETSEEVLRIAKTFRQKNLPVDALYLDIDFMDSYRSFTVQPENFSDVAGMIKTLQTLHFKTVAIVDPGVAASDDDFPVYSSGLAAHAFVQDRSGHRVSGVVWPGLCVFPDFTNRQVRTWWGQQYSALTTLGIDGFWNDMNEPSVFRSETKTLPWEAVHFDHGKLSPTAKIHNVYGLAMAEGTKEGLDALRPNQRNFVLTRAAYAGTQRYAAVWTGDNTSDWDHLRLNLTMALNMGLSGLSFVGSDIGGYADSPTPELFARWMELGSLFPLYRNHTEKETDPQEPWEFGKPVEDISRQILNFRYRLQAYLYDLAWTSHQRGDPMARPLFYEFPRDDEAYKVEDEFLLGSGLLAAPVLEPGQTKRSVYLPAGTVWFDWETGQEYRGGERYTVEAPLSKLPLFVRAGAIIPYQWPEQFTHQMAVNPITVNVWPGANGRHTLYLDDGESQNYKNGDYLEIEMAFRNGPNAMTVEHSVVHRGAYLPEPNYLLYRIHNLRQPRSVTLDGKAIPLHGDSSGVTDSDKVTAWYENDNSLLIKVFHPERSQNLDILF